ASLHLEDSEDEDEAASNKSKKPRKATNLSSARASLFDQVSKQMTAKIASIQARVQDAKKAQTDEAAATKPSNSTDVATRKLYNDALEACLLLVQGWADKTVLVAAAEKHNDMLKAKAEDGKEPELVDVTVEDTVAEQSPCLRLAIAAAGTSINVERGTFLRTQACMQHFAESIPATAVDADQLDKQRLIWRRVFNCVTQLETSLKKCCGDVTKHVGSLAAAAEKDAKKQRDKEAKDAAANHMAAVQKKMKQAKAEGSDAPAIFRLEQGKLTTMKVVKGNAIPSDADLSTSFVLQECSHVKTWSDNAVCLQVLTNFGARYKKANGYEQAGKVTQPFQQRGGNEATEKFFGDVLAPVKASIVDISEFAQNWMTTSWMFGLQPKRIMAGLPPNCAACLRVLVYGEIEIYTFSTLSFLAALKEKGITVPSSTAELEQAVLDTTVEQWDLLQGKLKPTYHLLKKDEVLFTPVGHMVVEKTSASTMIYGARKSVLFKGIEAITEYAQCVALAQKDGKNTEKMVQVQDALKAATGSDQKQSQ
ncbi:Tnr, partial [Symbiodinium necroappetens]